MLCNMPLVISGVNVDAVSEADIAPLNVEDRETGHIIPPDQLNKLLRSWSQHVDYTQNTGSLLVRRPSNKSHSSSGSRLGEPGPRLGGSNDKGEARSSKASGVNETSNPNGTRTVPQQTSLSVKIPERHESFKPVKFDDFLSEIAQWSPTKKP